MNAALLVAPDFLLIALGVLLARRFAYGAPFWEGVERLVYFVLFPALLFRSLATAPLAIGDAGALALTALGYTGGAMVLSALARPLFALPRETFAACFQCGFRFNTYLVLAVASSAASSAAEQVPREHRRRAPASIGGDSRPGGGVGLGGRFTGGHPRRIGPSSGPPKRRDGLHDGPCPAIRAAAPARPGPFNESGVGRCARRSRRRHALRP